MSTNSIPLGVGGGSFIRTGISPSGQDIKAWKLPGYDLIVVNIGTDATIALSPEQWEQVNAMVRSVELFGSVSK